MILDSSVIVSITLREPGYEGLVEKMRSADTLGIGTPTLTEAGMVLSARLGAEPQALLDRFLRDFGVVTVPFGDQHWREALEAFRRFGKGASLLELQSPGSPTILCSSLATTSPALTSK